MGATFVFAIDFIQFILYIVMKQTNFTNHAE
jgi:hypothetical protein